jgi:hypothetical protein
VEELEARAEHELMPVVQACAGVMGNNVSMDQMCWALKVVDELAVVIPPSPGAPPSPHHATPCAAMRMLGIQHGF